jgi:hypothetical protein
MALREWLLLFVDYIATKHGMSEVLNSIVGGTSDLYSASTAQMKKAMAKLVDRAVASGDIRLHLDPLDLLRALAGVAKHRLGTRWSAGRQTSGRHPDRGSSDAELAVLTPGSVQRAIPPSIVRLEPVM